ncbi:hypothetical protein K474DRAFT_660450 [Panus rudis PR-1116 ss-1]|nr:hypothetical protein K474DRAFT_660450 [Panus rudis PR-1116 ss-1]
MCRRIAQMRLKIPVKRGRDGRPAFGRDAHRKASGANRPKHPSRHHGVWQPRSKRPRITAEWDRLPQDAKEALNDALEYARKPIFDRFARIVRQDFPEIVETMTKVRCFILNHAEIRKTFDQWPGLNLGPMFTTIAISERGSEKYHIDWLDDPNIPAIVIPLGSFGQGRVCFPQLRRKFSVRPGDGCATASRHLVHCAEVLGSGHRDVLTLFTHRGLVKAAERWWDTLTEKDKARRIQLAKKYDEGKSRKKPSKEKVKKYFP